MSGRAARTQVAPINVIFKYLQTSTKVCIWLFDNQEFKLEGKIIGFDEFMNVTLDDAEEVWVKVSKAKPVGGEGEDAAAATTTASRRPKREYGDRRPLGRLLLKGENITLIAPAQKPSARPQGQVSTQMEE